MDLMKMLAELRSELGHIDEAILALERLAAVFKSTRRGHPPAREIAQMQRDDAVGAKKSTPKRKLSPEGRKRISEAARHRWAKQETATK